ncbi:hypothetical protein H0H92_012113 [Tricholoma furcatifolium]|nr:hypothetical protein H0H92_012113 [Tricholoma furcatifolium]
MGNIVPLDAGVTALVTGQSGSSTEKQVIAQVVDNNKPAETFYLYGEGANPFVPPKGDPPIKIAGKDGRQLFVFVKNGNKQSALVQTMTLFFADEAGTINADDAIVVVSLLKTPN